MGHEGEVEHRPARENVVLQLDRVTHAIERTRGPREVFNGYTGRVSVAEENERRLSRKGRHLVEAR